MPRAAKLSAVFLLFLALSAVYTAPLYRYLNTGFSYASQPARGDEVIPFREGDSVQIYYHFWMAWDYVTGGPGPFFRDPYEFSDGEERIFTTRRLLISLIFILFAPFGTVFAFNALMLLCVALSGFCAYLLARHITGSDGPALVAGLIYGFFPFAIGQLMGGHTNGFLLFFIPLILFWIEKGISTGKTFYFLLTFLGFVTFSLIEYHLLYYMFILVPPFFLFRMAMARPGWKNFFRYSLALGLSAAAAMAVMMAVKHYEIAGSAQEQGRKLKEVMLYSPHWRDYFHRFHPNSEKNIFLGFFAVAGGILALVFSGWRRPIFWLYAGIFVFFAFLTLGISSEKLAYPYRFMYEHLPYFSLSRLPGRMVVFAALALSVLAALGLSSIKKSAVLSLIFFVGIGAEFFPRSPVGISLLPPKSSLYEYVRKNIGNQKLLCLPIWPGDTSWSSIYLYYVTLTRVQLVNGYYPIVPKNYIEGVFYPLYSMNVGEVTPEQFEKLRRLRVKYVVFHEEAFPGKVSHFPARVTAENLCATPYLRLVMREEKHWLFEVLPAPHPAEGKKAASPIGIYLTGKKLKETGGSAVSHRLQILPPGEYEAVFSLRGKGAQKIPLRILGNEPLARKNGEFAEPKLLASSSGKEGKNPLSFKLEKAQLVTLEIPKKGDGTWNVEEITLTMKEESRPPRRCEAEELFSRGEIVDDPRASGGKAVCATPEKVAMTEMLYGPYRAYPAGNYTLRFWVKPAAAPDAGRAVRPAEIAAKLEVAADYGKNLLASVPLTVGDLARSPDFHPVELSFTLSEEQVLEFRVPYYRKTGLCVDFVELEKK